MDNWENKLDEDEARRLQQITDRQREMAKGDDEASWEIAGPTPVPEKRIEAEVNRPINMKEGLELAERQQHEVDLREQRLALEESQRAERVADRLSTIEEIKQERWAEITLPERTEALRCVGRELREEHGTPEPMMLVEDLPEGELGRYDPSTGEMKVDTSLVESDDPREAVRTYVHEFRHGFQDETDSAYRNRLGYVNAPTDEVLKWTANERDYKVPPETPFETYEKQPLEADSRRYSDEVIRRLYG